MQLSYSIWGWILLPSRLQFKILSVSVLIASVAVLLLGKAPYAAGENTSGFTSAATMSSATVCQTGVVEGVSCDGYDFLTSDAAPVEYSQMLDTASSSSQLVGAFAGRQFTVEDGYAQAGVVQDLPSVDDQSIPPPDETPAGAKVPEPASMVLLGVGLITMSRMSRRKRQPRQSQPVPRLINTCQHGPSLV